jgi:hypothetical protein
MSGEIYQNYISIPFDADSDDFARSYRYYLAHDSEMISPAIPI